jgi:hypothetical protein
MERLYCRPRLELFGHKPRVGRKTLGDEFAGSLNECYHAVRARVAAGGEGWIPRSS